MRVRDLVVGIAATAVLAAGCSSGHHRSAAPGPSSPNDTPNPDVVPAVITPAYVNAVFAVLNHINGNAVRAMLAAKAVTPTVQQDLRAIYNDPLYTQEITIVNQSLTVDASLLHHPVGDRVTTVRSLVSASPSCIFASTATSLEKVVVEPPSPAASEYYGLSPKKPGNDPHHLNPTPWAIDFNATYVTATSIPNQCER